MEIVQIGGTALVTAEKGEERGEDASKDENQGRHPETHCPIPDEEVTGFLAGDGPIGKSSRCRRPVLVPPFFSCYVNVGCILNVWRNCSYHPHNIKTLIYL